MKIPFYRTGKFLAGTSALVVATAVTMIVLFADKHHWTSTKPESAYITTPLQQVDIPTDSYTVDADSATEIQHNTGSKLHIPANAFKYEDGKLVTGKVELKYREFHDQKDIFISGIPMTYDSAGTGYVFESAGMMEITAFQNGKALAVNPDKPIKVDMVSNTKEDKYNTYYLDTTSKKWTNLNQCNLDPNQFGSETEAEKRVKENPSLVKIPSPSNPVLEKCEQEVKKTTAAVQACEKERPVPPAKADKAKTKFHIIVDAGEFPEIAMYKGVRFQVKDEANFDKSSAKVEWEDVKLKKLSGLDYEITFTKGSKKFIVVATPVIDDKDMAEAQKVYDAKFAQYQAKLTERKTAEEKAKREMEARAKEMEEQMKKAIADEKERNKVFEASLSKTQLVYRTFSVYRFGTYNCDSPIGWPTEVNVVADLTNEQGKKLELTSLNLVEKGRNAVFPYQSYNGECSNFRFNASKDNLLWAVTSDNKLAIVDVASFKAQQGKSGNVQFKFKIVDREFKSSDEVKRFLDI